MKVTDKNYYMDGYLLKKLDLMIKRMQGNNKDDNVLIVEGSEGEGKTNASIAISYYVAHQTGRKFDVDNIYFDPEKMIEDAKNSKEQIFIWDEPALSGLKTEWWNKTQIKLLKLLMMARKKRHFFVFNVTRFFKFNEYFVLERARGLIHVYSAYNKDGSIRKGNFAYFKKNNLENLYNYWRSTKRKAYKKNRSFYGRLTWVLPKLIDEDVYEKRKDEAIMSIGSEAKTVSKDKLELQEWKYKVAINRKKIPDLLEIFEWSEDAARMFQSRFEKAQQSNQNQPIPLGIRG